MTSRRATYLAGGAVALGLAFASQVPAWGGTKAEAPYAPVTDARLKNAATDPGWLMYRKDYASTGYSMLKQITTANVDKLKQVWDYKSSYEQGHESPPVVNGDYMYVTTPKDEVLAFKASTGKPSLELQARSLAGRPEDRLLRRGQPGRGPLRRERLSRHARQLCRRPQCQDRRSRVEAAAYPGRHGSRDDAGADGPAGQG